MHMGKREPRGSSDPLLDRIAALEATDLPDGGKYYPPQDQIDDNPQVARMAEDHPRAFAGFTFEDWRSIYFERGKGGAMTIEGVVSWLENRRPHIEARYKASTARGGNPIVAEAVRAIVSKHWPLATSDAVIANDVTRTSGKVSSEAINLLRRFGARCATKPSKVLVKFCHHLNIDPQSVIRGDPVYLAEQDTSPILRLAGEIHGSDQEELAVAILTQLARLANR